MQMMMNAAGAVAELYDDEHSSTSSDITISGSDEYIPALSDLNNEETNSSGLEDKFCNCLSCLCYFVVCRKSSY